MRLHRRAFLAGLGALPFGAAGAGARTAPEQPLIPITVSARAIRSFEPRNPDKTRFGALTFRGGLVLTASHPRFGGFSGIWRSPDGEDLVALTDNGFWLTARVRSEDGRLAGLEDAQLAPVLGASGRPLHRSRYFDTESLTISNGVAYVGVERAHEVLRFEFGRDGVAARALIVAVPREVKRLPYNRGLEAIAVVPAGHALAGALLAVAERSGREGEKTRGFILDSRQPGQFSVARHDGYDITDMAFLPDGDLALLERWYKPWRGVGMRIRRVPGRSIRPGAVLDGNYLVEADLGQEIDNMEGLCVHQGGGKTVLTLISDDNFSFLQRTVLLEFELAST